MFTGHCDRWGYGTIWSGPPDFKTVAAHRVALRLSGVHVPDDKLVLHSCDTPSCCEPAHLRVGDHADNMRDRSARGRCATKLTNEQAERVRRRRRAGEPAAELAEEFGVSAGHVRQLARGTRRP